MPNKQEITEIVVDFVKRTIPELKYADINTSAPLEDIGATSIDMLEVVSAAMRRLSIEVPRDALGDLETIDDLVELLMKVLAEAEDAAAPS